MIKSKYCVQKWNATAVNTLRAWLRAVGIHVEGSGKPGYDLAVKTVSGGVLDVMVGNRGDSVQEGILVKAGDFTGKRIKTALRAFHQVTDAAGYDRREPIHRGAEPPKNASGNPRKLRECEEPFLVGIRHTEFRRSVNPPEDRWQQYRATIEDCSYRWLYLNYMLCSRNGISAEDLFQYARCYTVNFVTRYETATPVHCDNERKLYKYIWQRFKNDLRPQLERAERSILPDYFTATAAQCVGEDTFRPVAAGPEQSYIWALDHETEVKEMKRILAIPMQACQDVVEKVREVKKTLTAAAQEDVKIPAPLRAHCRALEEIQEQFDDTLEDIQEQFEEVDYDYVARHCELNTSSEDARAATAASKLKELLDALPREKMQGVLERILQLDMYDSATRKEARKQLRLRGVSSDGLEVDEDLPSLDSAGAAE